MGGEVLFDVDDNDDADGGEKEAADEGWGHVELVEFGVVADVEGVADVALVEEDEGEDAGGEE